MKKILKSTELLIVLISMLTFSSCETLELELKEDPNALSIGAADQNLLLNRIQTQFASTMHEFGTVGSEVSRLKWMFGRNYQDDAYSATTFNGDWEDSYQVILKNIRVMTPLAEAKGLTNENSRDTIVIPETLNSVIDWAIEKRNDDE